MIPHALTVENFLSFGAEQSLTFEPDRVFLLSGDNGVGKSSVFDAILFALFNGHRAGQKDLHELIHKGRDVGRVVFDFDLGDKRYRAQRTVQRKVDPRTKQPRGQTDAILFEWQGEPGGWKPIPGTQKQEGFKRWVEENIGLRFETFTAAVLLMQNRAEQLVSNDAESARQRFEVLSRVVGLNWYEQIHAEADSRRKKAVAEVECCEKERDRIVPVTDQDLAAAGEAIERLRSQVEQADSEVTVLAGRRDRAADWARVSLRLAERRAAVAEAQGLIGGAEVIERDGLRAEELTAALPEVETYVGQEADRRAASECVSRLEEQLRRAGEEAAAVAGTIAADELRQGNATQRESDLLAASQAVDGDKKLLDQAAKLLQRLDRERGQFLKNRGAVEGARARLGVCEDRIKTLSEKLATAKQAEEDAGVAAKGAFAGLASCRIREEHAQDQFERFRSVADDRNCRYCGQKLTPDHAASEQRRLEQELDERTRELAAAETQYRDAQAAAETAGQSRRELGTEQAAAAGTQSELNQEIALAAQAAELHAATCEETRAELPEPYRSLLGPGPISDWNAVTYPTDADWSALRERQAALAARHAEITNGLAQARAELKATVQSLKSLRARGAEIQNATATATRELGEEQSRVRTATARRDDSAGRLKAPWVALAERATEDDLEGWRAEVARLQTMGAAENWSRLQQARTALDPLRDECRRLQAEADGFAAEDRQNPEAVAAALTSATARRTDLHGQQVEAGGVLAALNAKRVQREDAVNRSLAADRDRHLWTRLAELLGRKRLQRHLLRQAEHGIVDQANRLLDRLTGGVLTLRLQGDTGDDERALELEATKTTTNQTFPLSFLSGSERFRVAVALALAIGQYGCRRRRPIESVIIDEGFGCLDRTNRQAMIDELGALREQLRCVVLVSHQEEFAEAFRTGYRFHLVDGATRVVPSTT
jgi:DNA repair exonuclease SbcCD ATPase subunit